MMRYTDPLAVRLYRRALVILPRWFRRANGDAMVAMIADEWRAVRGLRRVTLLLRSVLDLLWTAIAEQASRWSSRRPASRGGGRPPWSSISALDIRLGVRMLAKYPGLSLVSVIGMAVAIAIGAGVFSLIASLMVNTVPLPEGDRIVAVRNGLVTRPTQTRASLRDFNAWRTELRSVEDLAAFTKVQRNIAVPGAGVDLVRVVRMTASGFALSRTAPMLGRTLLEEDEHNDARVVVIAHEEWQRRFAADPDIIGRSVNLGPDEFTIVGVMPAGFAFPVNDRFWIPLVFTPAERAHEDEVLLTIAGRLAEGATFESTQAELNSIGARTATYWPGTNEQLRPRVLAYPRAFFDVDNPQTILALHMFRFFISVLLIVVAVNVAILVYARTATRVGEIAVRTALGASRARVVTQLFAEALVLSLTAALVGLALAGVALNKLQQFAEQDLVVRRFGLMPFWIDLGLSPAVIAYALALAIVAAVIVGVVPALKATGRGVHVSLQQLSGRGVRMQLGRTWTALIITQVAAAVAVLPFAVHFTQDYVRSAPRAEYPTEEFLEASIQHAEVPDARARFYAAKLDTSAVTQRVRDELFRARAAELIRRLESDPAVAGVTFRYGESERVEVEDIASPGSASSAGSVSADYVDPDRFALYGMPIVAGRSFVAADVNANMRSCDGVQRCRPDIDATSAVIVNSVFAERRLGRNLHGRRLRYVRESAPGQVEPGPWLDIVGVVQDFAGYETSRIYMPAYIAQLSSPVDIAIRVRVEPATRFAPRLRQIAAAVDPMLQLDEVISAAEAYRQQTRLVRSITFGTASVLMSVLLLSAAGIYAMMSFTVTKRRREIGIRSALGAQPRRVLINIFARASAQISAGILLGLIGTLALERMTGKGAVRDGNVIALLLVALLMTTIGLLAAIGPARRGLAVQPTEALREE